VFKNEPGEARAEEFAPLPPLEEHPDKNIAGTRHETMAMNRNIGENMVGG
jgi:hypothetical protein